MSDIFKRAEDAITPSLIEQFFSANGSKWHKGEFWTLSPLRNDSNVKSGTFSINDRGLWFDLATGESGNFLQLISRAQNISIKEAAEKVLGEVGQAGETGGDIVKSGKSAKPAHRKNDNTEKPDKPAPVIPIPSGKETELKKLVNSKWNIDTHGQPVKIYVYKNIDQEAVCCVCRYEKPKAETGTEDSKPDKNHIPYYYTESGWRAGRPPGVKMPLYGEHRLKPKTADKKTVVIVEGEPCASCIEVDGYIFLSWIGGTGSVESQSFSKLKNRKVIIWPDNDEAGLSTAYKIKKKLPHAQILDVETLNKPEKWDIADAVKEEFDVEGFLKSGEYEKTPVTPYETFLKVIDEIYGRENIVQLDGIYYIYRTDKHYWEERLQINIESDIQQWIRENHVQFIEENGYQTHSYIANTVSFLKRWQKQYYNGNPMKNSALQPHIHFRNGCVEIKDDCYVWHDREEKGEEFFRELYPLTCLDFDFDTKHIKDSDISKTAPAFYHYLRTLVPESLNYEEELQKTVDFFSQTLAYCLSPIKRQPYFFALYGGQQTGKSFFLELLEDLIGESFILQRRTSDMENRFAAADLWGSKIFVDDDVKANLKLPDDFIKNYSGSKNITIEKKNKDAIKGVRISVAMFFISNHSFSISGGVEGIERRLIYIPYKKKIENPDVFLRDKIRGDYPHGKESPERRGEKFDERPAMIGMALRGLDLFLKNDYNFVMPEWIARERKDWLIHSNSISQFLHEEIYPSSNNLYRPKEIYDLYTAWCDSEKRKSYGRNSFYEKLKLEDRIDFDHSRNGDMFIVWTDKALEKQEEEKEKFPM